MEETVLSPYGYELQNGLLVQSDTGEVIPYSVMALPEKSTVNTPLEKERKRKWAEEMEAHAKKVRSNNPFVFVKKELNFVGVPPAMATRLIYLSTYMQYDGNKLMLSTRKAMTRKDIADVLGISPRNAVNFWDCLHPAFLTEDSTGALILNEEIFKRGKRGRGNRIPYERVFQNGVRKLYESAYGKYHKQMGYLFELLPYISIEYNVLCRNPYEKDIQNVELLSIAEFCKLIGYSLENIDKLRKIYSTIRFPVGDHQELFCKMIYDGIHSNDAIVCINPNILYSGSNPRRIEISKLYFSK